MSVAGTRDHGEDADFDEIRVKVTYLEMVDLPERVPVVLPAPLAVVHSKRPSVAFYRFLYHEVGNDWMWVDRKLLTDRELSEIVQDDRVEVHVLLVDGCPAGYAELDLRRFP